MHQLTVESQLPEGEKSAHVQLRQQLSFGLWVRQTIPQCLKSWNH